MIKERIKSVGKKKVLGIATVFMLVGGGSALASEPGQNAVQGAIDTMFKNAVTYYVNNIDKELTTYAEQQKGSVAGDVAYYVDMYMKDLQTHYANEIKRGKERIATNKNNAVSESAGYAGQKHHEAQQAMSAKVNEEINEADAEIRAAVEAEFIKYENTQPQ